MPRAGSSISLQASNDFHGNSALRSASAAFGAIFSSQKVRRLARKSRWTSVRAKVEVLTGTFSQAPRKVVRMALIGPVRPGARTRSVGLQVPDQQLRQLDGRHLRDPVRHVVEHLEGGGPL